MAQKHFNGNGQRIVVCGRVPRKHKERVIEEAYHAGYELLNVDSGYALLGNVALTFKRMA